MTNSFNSIKCKDITWEGRADCLHCLIRRHDVLATVDVAQHEELLRPIIQYKYCRKNNLYNQGDEATDLFIVRNGMLKLEETLKDGTARIVRLIHRGGIAGIETLLDQNQSYEQSAIAVHETEVCKIPFRVFHNLMNIVPEFIDAIMKQWQQQLEASENVLINFSTGPLKQRLARIMLMLVEESYKQGNTEINMLQIEDIAALTGVTKESVSRVLAEFKRSQLLIKISPHRFDFDKEGLREIADS